MDLKQLDTVTGANAGADMTVYTPDGEKTDITIKLAGRDSDVFRKASRKNQDKRIKMLQKRGRQKMNAAEFEDESISLLADCTLGWDNLQENGKALEFSKENAERLYTDYPDIRRQVDEFIGEPANFLAR